MQKIALLLVMMLAASNTMVVHHHLSQLNIKQDPEVVVELPPVEEIAPEAPAEGVEAVMEEAMADAAIEDA